MINYIERHPIISLMLFVILMLGFTIDTIPMSIMEARNFVTAREMLTDNNWILTTFNGEARYEKPPLPTWITAIFGSLFGIQSILALRWPAIICLGFLGIGVFRLAKELDFKKEIALIIGFIALSSFYILSIIIEAPWDIYTHTFMLWAILFLFRFLRNEYKNKTVLIGIILFLAASVLSKGPIGIYALLLPFLIAYFVVFRNKSLKTIVLPLIGCLLLGILLGGIWYAYVRFSDPETFERITSKETNNWSSYNVKPFYYYWSFFLQSGLWAVLALTGLIYPFLKEKVSNLKAYQLTLLWTLASVVLLSVIPEKKSRYLMPALIPLALNIGFYVEYIINRVKKSSGLWLKLPSYLTFGIVGLACLSITGVVLFSDSYLEGINLFSIFLISTVFVLLGGLILIHLVRWQLKSLFYLSFSLFLLLGIIVLPPLKPKFENKALIKGIAIKTELKVYSLDKIAPEVIYYYGDKIPRLTKNELRNKNLPDQFILYTKKNQEQLLDSLIPHHKIEHLKTIDLNYGIEDGKGKRERLVNEIYKITKAEISSE